MSEVNTLENYLSIRRQHSKNIGIPYDSIEEGILTNLYKKSKDFDIINNFLTRGLKIKDTELEYLMGVFATVSDDNPDDVGYYSQRFKYYVMIDGLYLFYN